MTAHYELLVILCENGTDWTFRVKRESRDVHIASTAFSTQQAAFEAGITALGPLMWRRQDFQFRLTTFREVPPDERKRRDEAYRRELARLHRKYPTTLSATAARNFEARHSTATRAAPLPPLTLDDLL